jgi:hypothetical protein
VKGARDGATEVECLAINEEALVGMDQASTEYRSRRASARAEERRLRRRGGGGTRKEWRAVHYLAADVDAFHVRTACFLTLDVAAPVVTVVEEVTCTKCLQCLARGAESAVG